MKTTNIRTSKLITLREAARPKALLVATVLLVGAVGLIATLFSMAATPAVTSWEPEAATLASGSSVVTDTSASGSRAVKFASGTSSMQPPTGYRLIHDLTRRSNWVSETPTATVYEVPGTGPFGDPIIRSELVDGQIGFSTDGESERSDLRGPDVPLNSVRWMVWNQRFVNLPTTTYDRWQMMGPNEIHGRTLPQATVMPEVDTDKLFRLNANAGRATTRYFRIGPADSGWHQYKMGIYYTQNNTGWLELWRDGERVIRIDGPTTTEADSGYWKLANYRYSRINGPAVYDTSGTRVYAP